MNESSYKTRDLAESAALLLKGQKLINIERFGKTCWFVFANQNECRKISSEYFFGEVTVNAHTFYQALTKLKNRVFAERKIK